MHWNDSYKIIIKNLICGIKWNMFMYFILCLNIFSIYHFLQNSLNLKLLKNLPNDKNVTKFTLFRINSS